MRGVNNVGSRRVTMAALKSAFQAMGLKNVRTVLASGNIIFESPRRDPHLDSTISEGLEKSLGFHVTVITRTVRELREIVASGPFKAAPSGPGVQQYVTFLTKRRTARSGTGLPSTSEAVRILRIDRGEIFSVVMLSEGGRTPDLMRYLDRNLGPTGTTRNWRTVLKLAGGEE
ncbi:MAG TPA: DUF1697 domain-containing protein [Acidobacteriota bacterium]|nr:DUF1697 domain-containing protein [Acidobacteriota bacterium]